MSQDPRIEAAARQVAAEHGYPDFLYPDGMAEVHAKSYREQAARILAAADKAATITTREEFDALPKSATILGKAGDAFQWGTDFDDVTQGWCMAGSNTPTPIRALMTFGPFTVIHWGTE